MSRYYWVELIDDSTAAGDLPISCQRVEAASPSDAVRKIAGDDAGVQWLAESDLFGFAHKSNQGRWWRVSCRFAEVKFGEAE